MSLMEKLLKNSTIKQTALIPDSKVYGKKTPIVTDVPMLNVALSGSIDGGFLPGLLMISGPSKHFKTGFSMVMASSFLKKFDDGLILFYDSEFGSNEDYFDSFGVDKSRVVHTPIKNIEELKFDVIQQLENIDKKDNVLIIIDSIGNLASKKEVEDAKEGKSVADMTRAKQLKSLWRMVTPYLAINDIYMVAINHTYKEIGLYPKDIVSGGTGGVYSSNDIWIVGRQQDKDGTEISGYKFVIKIEKSRKVKEGRKIPIEVAFGKGVSKWSGLFDVALEGNYIAKPKSGWFQRVDPQTGEFIGEKNFRRKELENNAEFWEDMFSTTDFATYIEKRYRLGVADDESLEPEEEDEDY